MWQVLFGVAVCVSIVADAHWAITWALGVTFLASAVGRMMKG